MSHSPTISFSNALMICVNTIIGAGFFVNIHPLMKNAGYLGFLGYVAAFIVMLPSMIVIARFAQERPVSAGIYNYPREFLSPAWGFLSGWSYFVGKSATVALLTHALVLFLLQNNLLSGAFTPLTYDLILVLLLGGLNMAGVSIGGRIQWLFTGLKAIPFTAILVGGGLFLTKNGLPANISFPPDFSFQTLLPLALFAFSGFESICAIGDKIENAKQNAFRVIMLAGCIVLALYVFLQSSVTFVLEGACSQGPAALVEFVQKTFASSFLGGIIVNAAFISVLSGIFSNLANNSWNFHALARDGFFPFKSVLTKTNKSAVPWTALLLKISLIIILLYFTQQQVPLQNISVACVTISYMLNLAAAISGRSSARINQVHPAIASTGILFCFGILGFCYKNIALYGLSIPFISIFVTGIVIAAGYKQFCTPQSL